MKEKNHIKIITLSSILLIIFIIINSYINVKQYKEYSLLANIKINNLIYILKEKGTTDDEIFNILNSVIVLDKIICLVVLVYLTFSSLLKPLFSLYSTSCLFNPSIVPPS